MATLVKRSKRLAFTLVELLVVIIVLAVLAGIAIPRFMNSAQNSKDASLQADLKIVRQAVDIFRNDCGCYPVKLTDLARSAAPATGLSASASSVSIAPSDWHGPYLLSIPVNPVTGNALGYGTDPGNVGQVSPSALTVGSISTGGAQALD